MSCYPGNSKVCWKAKGHFSMILDEHAHHIKGGGLAFFFTNVANDECLHIYSTYGLTIIAAFQEMQPLDLTLNLLNGGKCIRYYHLSK